MQNFKRIPSRRGPGLRAITALAFALLVIAVSFVGGVIFHSYAERALTNLSHDLAAEAGQRITARIDGFLGAVNNIRTLNSRAAESGRIDLTSPRELAAYLMREVEAFPGVHYSYFANMQGGIVTAGTDKQGNRRILATDDFRAGRFARYSADENGARLNLLGSIPFFDARDRDWFINAVESKGPVWTEVYPGALDPVLGLSCAFPAYGPDGGLRGVFGVDIILYEMNAFLRSFPIGRTGLAFIYEPEGGMLAASTPEDQTVRTVDAPTSKMERIQATEAPHPLIRAAARTMLARKNPAAPDTPVRMEFTTDGQRYFLHCRSYRQPPNLHWQVAVVIPADDYLGSIFQLRQDAIILTGAATLLAILFAFAIAGWIIRPVEHLSEAAADLADGHLERRVNIRRNDEIGVLADAFNRMAERLRDSFEKIVAEMKHAERLNISLREARSQLEEKVRERTASLEEVNRELEQQARIDPLTGAFNRGHLFDAAESMRLAGYSVHILMVDFDHFKNINDTYGHRTGDQVLRQGMLTIRGALRDRDAVVRYGGEEFAALLPGVDDRTALRIAERIRTTIAAAPVQTDGQSVAVTISIGLSRWDGNTLEAALDSADKALYRAKEEGRNRVRLSPECEHGALGSHGTE